jgi:hypothetical protein
MVILQIASMGIVMQDTRVSARISWNTRKWTFVLLLMKKKIEHSDSTHS